MDTSIMLCIDKVLICKIVCLFWIARAKSRNNVLILFLEKCKKKMLMHDKFDFDWPQVDVTLDWLQSSSLSFEFVLPSLSKFIHYPQSASPSENKLALVWAGGTCKHKQKRRRRSKWPKIESAHVVRFMSASMEKIDNANFAQTQSCSRALTGAFFKQTFFWQWLCRSAFH